jgi:hypothetical protein
MKISVIRTVANWLRIPKLYYVIFQEEKMLGLYTPKLGNIFLDAYSLQSFFPRLECFVHELIHHISNINPTIYHYTMIALDITDGHQKHLLYEEDDSPTVILHVFY